LALQNDETKRRYFADGEFNPDPDIVYEWFEIAYKDSKYPSIPRYSHEPIVLGSLSEFAGWSKDQQIIASQAHHKQKRQDLTRLD
jgi:hypothetical protein